MPSLTLIAPTRTSASSVASAVPLAFGYMCTRSTVGTVPANAALQFMRSTVHADATRKDNTMRIEAIVREVSPDDTSMYAVDSDGKPVFMGHPLRDYLSRMDEEGFI